MIRFLGAPRGIGEPFLGESLEGARTTLRCNDQFAQLKAAEEGLGIIEAACYFGDKSPGIRRVWPHDPPVLKPMWLLFHEDMRRATRVRVLSDAIVETFQQHIAELRSGTRARSRVQSASD